MKTLTFLPAGEILPSKQGITIHDHHKSEGRRSLTI